MNILIHFFKHKHIHMYILRSNLIKQGQLKNKLKQGRQYKKQLRISKINTQQIWTCYRINL